MPYIFGFLVLLNALMLGSYLFFPQTNITQSLQDAQANLSQPIEFINSASYIPPAIGEKDQ